MLRFIVLGKSQAPVINRDVPIPVSGKIKATVSSAKLKVKVKVKK